MTSPTYEYEKVTFDYDQLGDQLQKYGDKGWRVVHVFPTDYHSYRDGSDPATVDILLEARTDKD